jgi:pimeloyl-ACP methyl ester carboxylesterase
MFRKRHVMHAIAAAIAVIAADAAAFAPCVRAADGPLVIARQGYFFVGGKIDTSIEGSPVVGQMYVEFHVPQTVEQSYPLVMIHGGGQTGTNFTGTPDGREGWAQYFLRHGYTVYVVDQVARGRAANWAQVYGAMTPPRFAFTEQRFARPEDAKLWPQAHLHTQWPGTGKPGDPVFEQFYASQVPSIADFAKQQELNRDAGAALLDRIGPAIVLTHSQSGAFGWPIADARPHLVKAIVAVEPSGPPVHDVVFKGAPDWFADAAPTKRWGLGEVPLTYDPPGAPEFVREEKSDAPDLVRCWVQKSPARQLVNLQSIPVLVVTSEASYHASYDHCTVKYLRQAGVSGMAVMSLPAHNIHGNGHMMMLEKNSDEIAAAMMGWLNETFAAEAKKTR